MRKLFPYAPFYSDIIRLSWSFIEREVIDHANNGWLRQAGQMGLQKAAEWHANYHSGRALMNCLDWLCNRCESDFFEPDGDIDGNDLAELIKNGGVDVGVFAEDFGRSDCP